MLLLRGAEPRNIARCPGRGPGRTIPRASGQGGTEQIVIQDLSLYNLELKPAIARSNLVTPIREAGSIGMAVADEAGLTPRVSSEPSALVDVFEPPTISLPTEQGDLSPVVEGFIRAGS